MTNKQPSTVKLKGIGLLETVSLQLTVDDSSLDKSPDAQRAVADAGTEKRSVLSGRVETAPTGSIREHRRPPLKRTDSRLVPGALIGKYQLIRELGRGGMGAVFMARDTRLGRRVALKVLSMRGADIGQSIIKEARATAQCHHENIVVIHEASEYEGLHYLVLEYLEGHTLYQLLHEQGPVGTVTEALSTERAVEIMVPVVRALEHAHGMGIVHRDLKLENVMLTDQGSIKVLDFGIAKVLAEQEPAAHSSAAFVEAPMQTASGVLVGTMPYMSPEQVRCEPTDHRTDIWSVGIMLYELVTGKHPLHPFSRDKLGEIAQSELPMPRLSELRPELGALGQVVDRCLLKSLDARTSSTRELLEQLEPLLPSHRERALRGDESPFAGLAAYQETDAARFFGRSEDVASVVARVRSHPLVALIGPSGVGKSSLVRAGVIPAFKQSGEGWEAAVVRPGRTPLSALGELMEQFYWRFTSTTDVRLSRERRASRSEASTDEQTDDGADLRLSGLTDRLRVEPGLLGTEMRAWAQAKLRRVLIFVDQFEEIFTMTTDAVERQAFIACLAALADDASSPLRVVLSMRGDFLEQLAQDSTFITSLAGGMVFLQPMTRVGLRQALQRPIEPVGYKFEDDAVIGDMLDALETTRGALPLLQFAASKLWDVRDRQRKLLTVDGYESIGGISGALANHADSVLSGMGAHRRTLTRAIFERLVTPERTRAIASLNELRSLPGERGQVEHVLEELAKARLLLFDAGAGGDGSVEIVHESLIESWPTLRRWLDENQEDAVFLARLRAAAKEWDKSARAEGMLWRGDVADEARHFQRRYQGDLGDIEKQYIEAVFRLAAYTVRRRRVITYAATAVGLLLIMVVVFALTKSQQVATIRAQEEQLQVKTLQLENSNQKLQEQSEQLRQLTGRLQDNLSDEQAARGVTEKARAHAESMAAAIAKEKQTAEKARDDANRQRAIAESALREAEEQRRKAESARDEAEAERKKTVQANKLIEKQKREIRKLSERLGVRFVDLTDDSDKQ